MNRQGFRSRRSVGLDGQQSATAPVEIPRTAIGSAAAAQTKRITRPAEPAIIVRYSQLPQHTRTVVANMDSLEPRGAVPAGDYFPRHVARVSITELWRHSTPPVVDELVREAPALLSEVTVHTRPADMVMEQDAPRMEYVYHYLPPSRVIAIVGTGDPVELLRRALRQLEAQQERNET